MTDKSETPQYISQTYAIVGPLLDQLENSAEYSQPNYTTIDQGKIKHFTIIAPILVEINILPITLTS